MVAYACVMHFETYFSENNTQRVEKCTSVILWVMPTNLSTNLSDLYRSSWDIVVIIVIVVVVVIVVVGLVNRIPLRLNYEEPNTRGISLDRAAELQIYY